MTMLTTWRQSQRCGCGRWFCDWCCRWTSFWLTSVNSGLVSTVLGTLKENMRKNSAKCLRASSKRVNNICIPIAYRQYLHYSEVWFSATHCTDESEWVDHRPTLPRQISPSLDPRNFTKLWNRPVGEHPLRNSYEMFRVCGWFHDVFVSLI